MKTRHFNIPANRLWLVLLALVLLPYIELSVFFWVASRIGLPMALILLAATSYLGFHLLRSEGKAAFARLIRTLGRGQEPEGAARASIMVVLGGVLMILPGFVTDVIGLALMTPSLLSRRERPVPDVKRSTSRQGPAGPRIIDLQREDWKPIDE